MVSDREAAEFRLGPRPGRIPLSPQLFSADTQGLAASAFFFDWNWQTSVPADSSEPLGEIVAAWDAVLIETEKLSEEVKSGYTGAGAQEAHG